VDFIHRTAEGQIFSAQDKRGALAILEVVVKIVIHDPEVVEREGGG